MEAQDFAHASEGRFSVDWSLIAITAVAVGLLVVTTVRTGPDLAPGTPRLEAGLQVLASDERLVSFEDFSFGAQGWTAAPIATGTGELASMFGPFDDETVAKSFGLPADTAQVRVAFDLRLIEGASGRGPSIAVNGERVIESHAFSEGFESAPNAVIRRSTQPGDYAVWIELDNPGDALSLELEAAPGAGINWAIDNVSVVASTGTS